jgi:GWxTD domain-containing protein
MLFRRLSIRFLYLLFFLFLSSCISVSTPFRSIVNPYSERPPNQPAFSYSIVHEDEKFSTLYFNFDSSLLSFKKNESDSLFRSVYRIVCHLQKRISNRRAADSVVFLFKSNFRSVVPPRIQDKCKIKLAQGSKYFLELIVQDVLSGNKKIITGKIDKTNDLVSDNYYLTSDTLIGSPISVAHVGNSLFFRNKRLPLQKSYDVAHYPFSTSLASPPFDTEDDKPNSPFPDTSFRLTNQNNFFYLQPTKNGIYICRTNMDASDALKIPILKAEAILLPTFRYLTTIVEFDSLMMNQDKMASEKTFWLKCSGDQNRAVVLMSEWKRRIEISNYYFTSDREGWRTDRGMIYLLFGPPAQLNFTLSAETWIFHDGLIFEFKRRENSLSDNDFVLERKQEFSTIWYGAVDTWRQGRINYGTKLKSK